MLIEAMVGTGIGFTALCAYAATGHVDSVAESAGWYARLPAQGFVQSSSLVYFSRGSGLLAVSLTGVLGERACGLEPVQASPAGPWADHKYGVAGRRRVSWNDGSQRTSSSTPTCSTWTRLWRM